MAMIVNEDDVAAAKALLATSLRFLTGNEINVCDKLADGDVDIDRQSLALVRSLQIQFPNEISMWKEKVQWA